MILHKFTHRGTVAYPREVSVDFDALPTIIALHGPNGSGKTTFMDLLVTPLYLSMPFRPGPLYKHFEGRGFVDEVWSLVPGGPRYRTRLNVDPAAERVEASLFPAEGGPALAGPLPSNYLKKLRDLGIPPLDVFLSTAYTVQPSSTTSKNFFSFLLADRASRREIFAELLGLKSYAVREAFAKDRMKGLDALLGGNAGLIRQLGQEVLKKPVALEGVAGAEAALAAARVLRDDFKKALEGLHVALSEAKVRVAAITPLKGQRDVLAAEIAALQSKRAALEKGLVAARADVAAAEQAKDAPAKKEALVAQRAALRPLNDQLRALDQEVSAIEAELLEIGENLRRDEGLLAEEEAILAAVDRSAVLGGEIGALDAEIESAMNADSEAASTYQDWLRARDGLRIKCAELERLELQVSTMDLVPCKGQEAFAGCRFLSQAAAAQQQIPSARADVSDLELQVGEARAAPVVTAAPLKSRRAVLVSEKAGLAGLAGKQAELASARSRVDGMNDRKGRLGVSLDDKRAVERTLKAQLDGLPGIESDLREVEPLVLLAAKGAPAQVIVTTSTAALAESAAVLSTKEAARAVLEADLSGLRAAEAAVAQVAAQEASTAGELRRAETAVGSAEREVGTRQADLAKVLEAEQRLERLRAECLPLERDLEDWTLIARSQGPTGIPALKVDRAIPEISSRSTELLRDCLGETLFTILMSTQRSSADEKKLLETFDVTILRNGKEMDAALLSGGEGVLASEALALAIGLYTAERAGQRSYSLFRDEVGAALDVNRAPAYTRLLARAAKIGGFDKILFVSHHQRALELADARLGFRDGSIVVS